MTASVFTWKGGKKKSKGAVTALALGNYSRIIPIFTNGTHTDPQTHTHTQSFTAYDWLRPYTNFLPLITIKIVTLVFMQHKRTRAELRMARLFIVVLMTKGPSITGAYVEPDLCQWWQRLVSSQQIGTTCISKIKLHWPKCQYRQHIETSETSTSTQSALLHRATSKSHAYCKLMGILIIQCLTESGK